MNRYPTTAEYGAVTTRARPGGLHRGRSLIASLGTGAAIMYFADPDRGRRRRALVRDKVIHAGKIARESVGKTARDVRNRANGVASGMKAVVKPDHADDVVIEGRIRARLGRLSSHPSAITVHVDKGVATLSGDVLSTEVADVVNALKKVRGVQRVDNQLKVHERGDNVPSMQGNPVDAGNANHAPGRRRPATQLLSALAGGSVLLRGLRRGGVIGAIMSTAGAALAANGMLRRR